MSGKPVVSPTYFLTKFRLKPNQPTQFIQGKRSKGREQLLKPSFLLGYLSVIVLDTFNFLFSPFISKVDCEIARLVLF